MKPDLPFDDDTAVTAPGDDTAYKIATGVARVARAGAYVTGGALVASHGTGGSEQSGEQQLDSWNAGWAYNSDPQPDVPSPVVTFPDPVPSFTYDAGPLPVSGPSFGAVPAGPDSMVAGHGPAAQTQGGAQSHDEYPEFDAYWRDSDTSSDGSDYGYGTDAPFGIDSGAAPTEGTGSSPVTGGYGPGHDDPSDWWRPDGFGLPGHGTDQPGYDFGAPGLGDLLEPGVNPFLPTTPTAGEGESGEAPAESGPRGEDWYDGFDPFQGKDPFDGVGEGAGDGFGVWIETDAYAQVWAKIDVDLEIGPKGVYLTTDVRVDASAGLTVKAAAGNDVGEQIDKISEWMDGSRPGATGSRLGEQSGSTSTNSGAGGTTTVGTGTGASAPSSSPAAAPAPQPAPVVAAAPVAPVPAPAPAPAAPAAAAAAPVVATPLQTTVQPEAASNPIANVIGTSPYASPLVVPAAEIPAVLDLPTRPVPPVQVPDNGGIDTGVLVPGTTAPSVPVVTPTLPTPDASIPTTGISLPTDDLTIPDPTLPTTVPDIITTIPAPVTVVPTPDDGVTVLPDTGAQPSTTPSVSVPTPSVPVPSVDVPTQTAPSPTVPVPTQTVPVPTPTVPTQTLPTAGVPGGGATAPTMDLPTAPSMAVPTAAVPTNPPMRVDPISDDGAAAYHYSTYAASANHATLSSGLGSGLWSEDAGLYPLETSGVDPVLY